VEQLDVLLVNQARIPRRPRDVVGRLLQLLGVAGLDRCVDASRQQRHLGVGDPARLLERIERRPELRVALQVGRDRLDLLGQVSRAVLEPVELALDLGQPFSESLRRRRWPGGQRRAGRLGGGRRGGLPGRGRLGRLLVTAQQRAARHETEHQRHHAQTRSVGETHARSLQDAQ
jgi:hypothetical protein